MCPRTQTVIIVLVIKLITVELTQNTSNCRPLPGNFTKLRVIPRQASLNARLIFVDENPTQADDLSL